MSKPKPKPTVRQNIMASSGLVVGRKAVLAEVCSMCAGAERQCFDANNRFLSEKLGIAIPHISRHLTALTELGLLVAHSHLHNKKRCFEPAPALVEAYQIGKGAITELVRISKAATLTKTVSPPYQFGKPPLIKMVSPPYQNGKHNVLEQCVEKNVGANSVQEHNVAELLAATAAVEFLTAENAKLEERLEKGLALHAKQKKELQEQAAEIERLKAELAQRPAAHTKGANDVATSKPEKIPVYAEAVEAFHQIHPSLMGAPVVKFGAREGKEIKEVLTALKKIEGVDGWGGALDLFRAICMNWPALGKWYKGKFSTAILYGKLNEIISALQFDARAEDEQRSTLADFANR